MKTAEKIAAAARRHEIFVVRRRQRYELFCDQCGAQSEFQAIDDAVLFSGLTTREIVALVESGKLHYLETSGGHLFVCRTSLTASE